MLFVATAVAGDEEMRHRIEEHQRARPSDWSTLEVTTHVGSQISQKIGRAQVVIVDCVTLLANNLFSQYSNQAGQPIDASLIEQKLIGYRYHHLRSGVGKGTHPVTFSSS